MQYSVRSIMIVTAIVALLFVLPRWAHELTFGTLWFVIPAILMMFTVYGEHDKRAFAIGALTTYAAISLGDSNRVYLLPPFFWRIGTVVCAGVCSVLVRRRLIRFGTSVRKGE